MSSEGQRVLRERPERPVVRAVVAGGHQPRVFNLLVAPQRGQPRALPGEQLLGEQADAVHVEERAVGVEEDCAGFFHPRTVFHTFPLIDCSI